MVNPQSAQQSAVIASGWLAAERGRPAANYELRVMNYEWRKGAGRVECSQRFGRERRKEGGGADSG